jgi:hypothetical protein
MVIDHHDNFTTNVITKNNMVLDMEGKNLLEFRNNFHNFRNSIKVSMNFYRFKLALARLKLTDIPDIRFFLFLEPRKDQDLYEEIYFTIF